MASGSHDRGPGSIRHPSGSIDILQREIAVRYWRCADSAREVLECRENTADFLRWDSGYSSVQAQHDRLMVAVARGAFRTKAWENHPLWQIDPVMLPFHTAVRSGRFAGYAGPSRRPAAKAISKYIFVDMYAKAVQGEPPRGTKSAFVRKFRAKGLRAT